MRPSVKSVLGMAIAAAVLAAFLLMGRSPQAPSEPETAPTGVYTLRLGHNLQEQSALHQAALRFAEEVAKQSGGRVQVTVHPFEKLGNDQQMVEMARNGELDLILTPSAKLSVAVPAMQYADLPFYFGSREELYAMLDGEPGDMILKQLGGIGLIGVTVWENGFKQFTADRPIRGPDDFKGLKIRTMKSRLLMDQFQAMGATTLPLEFHALRQALADHVVDGQENPLVAIVGMNIHTVQRHLTLSNHGYLGYVFSISAKVYQALPEDVRNMLVSTAKAITPWERQETQRREAEFLEQVRAAGVEVHELTPAEREAFRQKMSPVVRRYEMVIGPEVMAKTEELRWRRLPAKDRETHLVIGLDADLSVGSGVGGVSIRRGMELAAEEINRTGGVQGRPLQILARDHGTLSTRGIRNLKAFADMPQAVAVFGGIHSQVALDELETAHQLGIPFLVPWAAATGITRNDRRPNYAFRLSAVDAEVIPFLMSRAARKGRQIGVLLERSAWGRSNEVAVQEWAEAHKEQAIAVVWFDRGTEEFGPILDKLSREGADSLVLAASSIESRLLVKAMAQRTQRLPIFSHWGLTGGDFWNEAQEDLKQVELRFVQTAIAQPPASASMARVLQAYRARYTDGSPQPIPAPAGMLQAYDLVHLLARAIRTAGSPDRGRIRDALERLPAHQGAVRRYDPPFTAERHDALGPEDLHLARFDAQGQIVAAE